MSELDKGGATDTVAPDAQAPSAGVPVESVPSSGTPADTAASGQSTEGEAAKPEPTRDRSAEKRISSLRRENKDLLLRLGRLEGLVEAGAAGRQTAKPADSNARPEPSQFKSYDEFVEALTDWKTDQKLASRAAQDRSQAITSRVTEANAKALEKLTESGKDIEDFDSVLETITASDFPVSPAMRDYLTEADHPAYVAQYLADHRKDAERIYGMNSAATVRELDKIAARAVPKSRLNATNAPPPVPTVGGRSVHPGDPLKTDDMEEYHAHWEARRAKLTG
ncbi:MAG TPA: hypothetical protein VF501_06650 [Thiobacillus sp.]